MTRLLAHVLEELPAAVGAGLSLTEDPAPRVIAGVGAAPALDTAQWEAGQGPLVEAAASGVPVFFDLDRPGEAAGGDWLVGAPPTLRSVVVLPGEWGGAHPMLFSSYLTTPVDDVVLDRLDRLEGLLATALAMVEHCAGEELRAQQMVQMVQYRRVIEQAKGLVMGALGDDAGTAFNTIARASQHFNVRLRHLCVALVEHVGGAPAEGPEDQREAIVLTENDRRVARQVWAALTTLPPTRSRKASQEE